MTLFWFCDILCYCLEVKTICKNLDCFLLGLPSFFVLTYICEFKFVLLHTAIYGHFKYSNVKELLVLSEIIHKPNLLKGGNLVLSTQLIR